MANERGQGRTPQQQQQAYQNQNDGMDLLGPNPQQQMQPQLMTAQSIRQSQAAYRGNQHSDLVEITITSDGKYLKAGQVLRVHPTSALILKQRGLISDLGTPYERPRFENKDITVDV